MRKTPILHDSIIGHFEYLKDSIIGHIFYIKFLMLINERGSQIWSISKFQTKFLSKQLVKN